MRDRETKGSPAPPGERVVGHQASVRALRASLSAGVSTVALVGPIGVGKTAVAELLVGEEPEGACLRVDLRGGNTSAAVIACVSEALCQRGGDRTDLAAAFSAAGIRLLLLDAAEECLPELLSLLRDWQTKVVGLQAVLTSRHRPAADDLTVIEVSPLAGEEAVELFAVRAREVASDFDLDSEDERERCQRIVSRLDGVPLLIELAASRTGVLGTRQLEERLRRSEASHSASVISDPNLEDRVARSWDLLSTSDQETLAQCAIFDGTFSLEAAEAVVALPDAADGTVLDSVHRLRARFLLRSHKSQALDGHRRLSLYYFVRQFALSRLSPQALAAVKSRFVAFYSQQAQAWSRQFSGQQRDSLSRFSEELGNLQAAYAILSDSDPDAAVGLIVAMGGYLKRCYSSIEAAALIESAFRAATTPASLAHVHYLRAVRDGFGSYESRVQDAQKAHDLSRESGQDEFAIRALALIALLLSHEGDLDRAKEVAEAAAREARVLGAGMVEALSLDRLAQVAYLHGQFREATQHWQAILRLRRERVSDRFAVALALGNLGDALIELGEYDRARAALKDAQEIHEQVGDIRSVAVIQCNMSRLLLNEGKADLAESSARRALELHGELQEMRWEGLALERLGCVALDRGEYELARLHFEEALRRMQRLGHARHQRSIHRHLVLLSLCCGEIAEARRAIAGASELPPAQGAGRGLLELYEGLALVAGGGIEPARLPLETAARQLRRTDSYPASVFARLCDAVASGTTDLHAAAALCAQENPQCWDLRMVQRACRVLAECVKAPTSEHVLEVGADGSWFQLSGQGPRVDLGRRHRLRRVLSALADARSQQPGVSLRPEELFAIAWPETSIDPESALNRLRVALSTLRRLGLEGALSTTADGYRIDPRVEVRVRAP